MTKCFVLAVAALLLTGSSLASAQNVPAIDASIAPPEAAPAAATSPCCIVPALTPVKIEFLSLLSSKTSHIGDHFAFRLTEPLIVDGKELVPAGTNGSGDVVHAAKSGMAGKAGELILAARYLDFNGTKIPLRSLVVGKEQGKDKTGSAFAVAAVVGLPAYFMSGGQVLVPIGTEASAKVRTDTFLPQPTTGDSKP
jgi:hypothetical protein